MFPQHSDLCLTNSCHFLLHFTETPSPLLGPQGPAWDLPELGLCFPPSSWPLVSGVLFLPSGPKAHQTHSHLSACMFSFSLSLSFSLPLPPVLSFCLVNFCVSFGCQRKCQVLTENFSSWPFLKWCFFHAILSHSKLLFSSYSICHNYSYTFICIHIWYMSVSSLNGKLQGTGQGWFLFAQHHRLHVQHLELSRCSKGPGSWYPGASILTVSNVEMHRRPQVVQLSGFADKLFLMTKFI